MSETPGFHLERESWRVMLNPLTPWLRIIQQWDLVSQIVNRNIQMRVRGSMLGWVWLLILPLMMLTIYTFVFRIIFNARWAGMSQDDTAGVALMVFCGMAAYNIFAESVTLSVGCVYGNPNYVKKVPFPLHILPASTALTSLCLGLVWFVVLIVGILVTGGSIGASALCLPLLLLPLFAASYGVSCLVASLGVYIRDTANLIAVILQMLFFLTPIVYPLDMVPMPFRAILQINPLGWGIHQVRKVMLLGHWPNWGQYVVSLVLSLVILQFGYIWFAKTKRGFADVL